jgi:hypothetical protein
MDFLFRENTLDYRQLDIHLFYRTNSNNEYSHNRSYIIIKQIALIFVYVFAASFYTWMRYINTITPMTFLRWIIEASFGPSLGVFLMDLFDIGSEFNVLNRPRQLSYTTIVAHKVLLFIGMRHAETYPSSTINNIHSFFIQILWESNLQMSINNSSNHMEL